MQKFGNLNVEEDYQLNNLTFDPDFTYSPLILMCFIVNPNPTIPRND